MVKKNNNEQEDINRNKIIDIVLVVQYMKDLDINNEFFTDKGDGFIEGLASVKDEIEFVSKDYHLKEMIKVHTTKNELETNYNDLKEKINEEYVSKDYHNKELQKSYTERKVYEKLTEDIDKSNLNIIKKLEENNKKLNIEKDKMQEHIDKLYNALKEEKAKKKRWFR
jgi:hypothetical protein